MNYSTFKKTVALSLVSLVAVGAANAQTTPTPAKVFGGAGQYNTWSIGVNVGALSPTIPVGQDDFNGNKVNLGYGISLRDQLAHNFGLQLDVRGGKVGGNAKGGSISYSGTNWTSFSTEFWQATVSGVFNVATIDFLRRKNAINFFGTAGAGLAFYKPSITSTGGATFKYPNTVKELIVPIGVGAKFRLAEAVALNLGYTVNFIDGDNFDGLPIGASTKDHFSYGYAGLEFTLGSKSKPSLEWANPVAMMYDELYDEALRQEVAALKTRVGSVEKAVTDLKKDSDGDGVSDQFDKCPNTAAGSTVDGAGCVIVFPKIDTSLFVRKGAVTGTAAAYSNIQFEFDSSVLRTSSYPVLDATSADLRSSGSKVEVAGFASSEGTTAHNLSLSKDRANSVKTYLVNSGVDAKKVSVKGYGETRPIADNSTEEGRVVNRRVEFKK